METALKIAMKIVVGIDVFEMTNRWIKKREFTNYGCFFIMKTCIIRLVILITLSWAWWLNGIIIGLVNYNF